MSPIHTWRALDLERVGFRLGTHETHHHEATPNDVAEILALRLAVGARMQERFGDNRWAPPISEGSVLRLFKGPRTRKSDGADSNPNTGGQESR